MSWTRECNGCNATEVYKQSTHNQRLTPRDWWDMAGTEQEETHPYGLTVPLFCDKYRCYLYAVIVVPGVEPMSSSR